MDGQALRQEIERCLRENKQTKRELSTYLEVLPQNLNRILENDNISVNDLQRIAAFLDRKLDYFVLRQNQGKLTFLPQPMNVPLVQQYAYAGYLGGFAQEEYVGELPTVPFLVDREYKGRYLCFEVAGDSMDDGSKESYEAGDIVLGREINPEYWKNKLHLHRWRDYVIVHKEDGVLLKEIIEHDVERHSIRIHSRNSCYADRDIDLNEVSQLFNVVKCIRSK